MKSRSDLFKALIFLWCSTLSQFVIAQSGKVPISYSLPSSMKNGPEDIQFWFDYQLYKESIGEKWYLWARIKTTAEPMTINGEYRYRYNGKIYTHNQIAKEDGRAMEGFNTVKIGTCDFNLYVTYAHFMKTVHFETFLGQVQLGEVPKDFDIKTATISFRELKSLYYSNESVVVSRITNVLALNTKREKYKEYITTGDNAYNSKNWATARTNYQQASTLFPNEAYPISQMKKVDEQIQSERLKQQTSSVAAKPAPAATGQLGNTSTSQPVNSYQPSSTKPSTTGAVGTSTSSPGNTTQPPTYTPIDNYNKETGLYTNPLEHQKPVPASNDKFTTNVNNTTTIINSIGAYMEYNQQEKLRQQQIEEAKEEQRYQMELERQRKEAEEKRLFEENIATRNYLVKSHPEKKIPLSNTEKADAIYFFLYAYDPSLINTKKFEIYISNAFEIGKYNDGTWPYQNTLMKEVESLTPYTETFHGYYYTMEEAERMQKQFADKFRSLDGVVVKPVTYKGKPSTKSKNTTTDYWGNSIKTAEPSSAPSQKKETTTYDYWGNPVKK